MGKQSNFWGGLISGVGSMLGINSESKPDQTQHNADREAARKALTQSNETYNEILKQQADTQTKRAEQEIQMSAQNNALMAAKIREQMNAAEIDQDFKEQMAKQAVERAKILNKAEADQFAEANKMKLIYLFGGGALVIIVVLILIKALK